MTDPYTQPNGTLRNRLGITDPDELAAIEHDVATRRGFEIAADPVDGRFDLAHLLAIHRRLFGDLYDWAGELRSVDIVKDDSYFCAARFISTAATDVFAAVPPLRSQLDHDPLIPATAGELYANLNALHPFRDGNGRAQRAFLWQLFSTMAPRWTGHASHQRGMTRRRELAIVAPPADFTPAFGLPRCSPSPQNTPAGTRSCVDHPDPAFVTDGTGRARNASGCDAELAAGTAPVRLPVARDCRRGRAVVTWLRGVRYVTRFRT